MVEAVKKVSLKRCAAIQIVFEYFALKDLIKVQQISRKFYNYTIPSICPRVPLPARVSFTEMMKE